MAETTSRIAAARRRASDAKQAAVALAAAAFLAIALVARQGHPGQASSASQGSGSGTPVRSQDDDGGFSLTPGTVASSTGSGGGARTAVS